MTEDLTIKNLSPKMLEALVQSPPLSYFWAVEYWDGTAISQFNPTSGDEIQWSSVLSANKRIKRVLWLPFSPAFAGRVLVKTGNVCRVLNPNLRMEATIPEGAKIIIKRKQLLSFGLGAGHSVHERAYVLGYEMPNGDIGVMARDSFGNNYNPKTVAAWIRGMSRTNGKGMLPEVDS